MSNSVPRSQRRSAKLRAIETQPRINADESPLSWLASRKDKDGRPMITREEFEAGEKLRRDYHFALLSQRITSNWSGIAADANTRRAHASASDLSDGQIAARERVNRALIAVGPELAGILIDVCCYLKGLETLERKAGWPQRSGKIVLQIALQRLARHYGMLGTEPSAQHAALRVRHWGAEGYRPRIDPEASEAS